MEDKKISPQELKAALNGDIDCLVEQVAAAMNSAQPGRIINDSEDVSPDDYPKFRGSITHSLCTRCLRFAVRITPANIRQTPRKTRFRPSGHLPGGILPSTGFQLEVSCYVNFTFSILLNGTLLSHLEFSAGTPPAY
ncbi:MAG: hypothetical protein K8S55_14115 [Phycisphaerae bacterium]|nr:hypothetical protein [Phycisphaerae bacterium]